MAGPYLIVALATGAVFICLDIVTVVFIFKYKIIFRTLFVISVAAGYSLDIILKIIINSMLGADLTPVWTYILGMCISGGWIAYLYQSKRVQNTFLPDDPETSGTRNDFI